MTKQPLVLLYKVVFLTSYWTFYTPQNHRVKYIVPLLLDKGLQISLYLEAELEQRQAKISTHNLVHWVKVLQVVQCTLRIWFTHE